MSRRSRRQPKNKRLELTFQQLLARLNHAERQRIHEELAQPFRRQWFIVDEHGVRRLE
jgi:hypothetical protein